MCVFVSRPMKIVTFLRKNAETAKRVVDFPLERDTFRNKNHGNRRGFSTKQVTTTTVTLEIVKDFACEIFFFIFLSFFHHFSPFFRFFFFILSFSFIFFVFLISFAQNLIFASIASRFPFIACETTVFLEPNENAVRVSLWSKKREADTNTD